MMGRKENIRMKVIAFYLPQFHAIPENDEWWGKGFTEWVNVKAAQKLYAWQNQPRVPKGNNYYSLLDKRTQIWQAELAKKYNIYGFCYYHYWFDGHMLLEKPMENMLKNKKVDIPFCICWANEDWTNSWVSPNEKILITQTYGNESEWKRHYSYLAQFFKDDRYIKNNNKPLMVIYRPDIIPCLNEMLDYINDLAKEDGFDGIEFAHQSIGLDYPLKRDDSRFTYDIEMQPIYAMTVNTGLRVRRLKDVLLKFMRAAGLDWLRVWRNQVNGPKVIDYDQIWQTAINTPPVGEKSIPCAFVDFDNTSRRKNQGWLFKGATVQKFAYYFKKYVQKAKKEYKTDMMFIFAWNEWAEGGYLEPDTKNGFGYLEEIKNILSDVG